MDQVAGCLCVKKESPLFEGAEHELIRSTSAGVCVFIKQNV